MAGYGYSSLAQNLGNIVTGINSSAAANAAANAGIAGINNGINSVTGLYGQSTSLNAPFIGAGAQVGQTIANNAAPATAAEQGAVSGLQKTASGNGLNVSQFYDPSMAFTLQQGTAALQRSQAANGGVLSGAALKDLTGYASGVASQNYQNAVTNALAQQSQQTSANTNLLSGGLTANSQLTPILNAGTSALGYQNSSANNAGNQLATLNTNVGQLAAQGINQQAGALNSAIGGAAQALGKTVGGGSSSQAALNAANGGIPSQSSLTPQTSGFGQYSAPSVGGTYSTDLFSDEATKTNIQAITPFSVATNPLQYGEGMSNQNVSAPQLAPISATGSSTGKAATPGTMQSATPASTAANAAISGATAAGVGAAASAAGGSSVISSVGSFIFDCLDFLSDEKCKTDMASLSPKDIDKSLAGMHPKSYDYTPEAKAMGAPEGRQVGVIAQDVEKTPAGGMVNETNPKTINVPKATSFLLAAMAAMHDRVAKLEK